MKVTIKWIEKEWVAFVPVNTRLYSTGIGHIVDQVERYCQRLLEPGQVIKWEAKDDKLIGTFADRPQGKLSKSDQHGNQSLQDLSD